MRTTMGLTAAIGAMALAGCAEHTPYQAVAMSRAGHGPLRQLSALTCPEREGALTRTGQAADGQSCDYQGPDGRSVRLSLVALDGRAPTEALAPLKAQLRGLVPVSSVRVPSVERGEAGEHTSIDLPFFHVHTAGDHAEVKMFGVHVKADGDYADVKTSHGLKNTVVHAGPSGAEIVAEDVSGRNASLVYVLAANRTAASGYAAVGYVAKGPAAGPLVVGEFRARKGEGHGAYRHHADGDHGDLDRLIERNLRG
jgi:hypothetical protein